MNVLTLAQKQSSGWYWRTPALLDVVQPPLTDEAVQAAQAQLGVRLPEAYLKLLRAQNGGYLRATWPASYVKMIWGIGPKAPSITLERARFRPESQVARGWSPPKADLLIPFDGDDHWAICFDYRKRGPNEEPSITLVDVECEDEEPVASSFVAFLSGLVDQLEKSRRVYGAGGAEAVARALARVLGAPEPRLDGGALGYPNWRIAMRGDHQWCWVSPNEVSAGFRRDGASQRTNVTVQTGLQIPEDPECRVLVSCTSESAAAVENALAELSLARVAG